MIFSLAHTIQFEHIQSSPCSDKPHNTDSRHIARLCKRSLQCLPACLPAATGFHVSATTTSSCPSASKCHSHCMSQRICLAIFIFDSHRKTTVGPRSLVSKGRSGVWNACWLVARRMRLVCAARLASCRLAWSSSPTKRCAISPPFPSLPSVLQHQLAACEAEVAKLREQLLEGQRRLTFLEGQRDEAHKHIAFLENQLKNADNQIAQVQMLSFCATLL